MNMCARFNFNHYDDADILDTAIDKYIMEKYVEDPGNEQAERWCGDIKIYREFEKYYNEEVADCHKATQYRNFNELIGRVICYRCEDAKRQFMKFYNENRLEKERLKKKIIPAKNIVLTITEDNIMISIKEKNITLTIKDNSLAPSFNL